MKKKKAKQVEDTLKVDDESNFHFGALRNTVLDVLLKVSSYAISAAFIMLRGERANYMKCHCRELVIKAR